VWFEPTISAFEREKTVHALDRAVTVIGLRHVVHIWRTPGRYLLEKLKASQKLKKFHVFYGTGSYITDFTNACYITIFLTR
jgi:hypothetical protein